MIEIVWQYDAGRPPRALPETAAEAQTQLERGNAIFAALATAESGERHVLPLSPADLGIGAQPDEAPPQTAFVAALCCSDARVPPELVFGQAANDLFVARVAGNSFGSPCIGSFEYAVANLPTLRQLLVLGHTGCGALQAAVGSYLNPTDYLGAAAKPALRSVVDSLMVAVHSADRSLRAVHGDDVARQPGYTAVLSDLGACLNAALGAHQLLQWFGPQLGPQLGVTYGVYDLVTRQVGLPAGDTEPGWSAGMAAAPADEQAFQQLARELATAAWTRKQLAAG